MDLAAYCKGCFRDKAGELQCPHCGFSEGDGPESPLHLKPGIILNNKYLIGRALGQGGFGITYLAWDINLNIKLAIKEYFPQDLATRSEGITEISPHTASMGSDYQYGLEKFLQEARTLARFEGHPNIVSIRDFFKDNGTAYFVMYYVEGTTLKDELKNAGGKMPYDKAVGFIIPVLDALREVHTANILHRDISPDNIFINQKGQIILLDFGAARQAVSDKGRSMSIILKPGYAPEEQYRSKGVQGPWTDIYAAAATFYHLITGFQPPEALERVSEDHLIPPAQAGVDLEQSEELAILKAMAVRAPDRFQNVGEFQKALYGGKDISSFSSPIQADPAVRESTEDLYSSVPEKISAAPGKTVLLAASGVILVIIAVIALWAGGIFETSGAGMAGGDQGVLVEGEIELDEGIYTGQLLDGIPSGEGTWEHPDGSNYEGHWQEGLAHGYGIMVWPSGDKYEGQWQEDEIHGEGTYISVDGTRYEGSWVNDMRHGHGVITWPSGDSYEGEWRGDLINGKGTMRWNDGRLYVGTFSDNMRHGEGKMSYPDGAVYNGEWQNDIKEGFGTFTFPGGEIFEGEFSNDQMHGQGKIIYPDSTELTGIWEEGQFVSEN